MVNKYVTESASGINSGNNNIFIDHSGHAARHHSISCSTRNSLDIIVKSNGGELTTCIQYTRNADTVMCFAAVTCYCGFSVTLMHKLKR